VREFACEQLSGAEEKELQRRHATCFLELVTTALPDLQAAASQRRLDRMQALKIEHSNFRIALEWSLKHDPVMALRLVDATAYFWADLFSDAYNLAEQALEKAAHVAPSPLVSSVLTIAANGAGRRGDYRRQGQLARQRLDSRVRSTTSVRLPGLVSRWGFCFETGDHQEAEHAFHKALHLFRARCRPQRCG
jgi:tetratricopeptide (TPR) repeat protein